MTAIELAEKAADTVSVRDVALSPPGDDASLYKQTRTRRLFTAPQMFAFTLVYFGSWYSIGGNIYFALQNGGPAGWLFSYLVVVVGSLAQVASFAEIASLQPIAGAQYYWTYHFAPKSMKMFLTWVQGWTTWLGYIAFLASCVNGVSLFLEGVISLNYPDTYEPGAWRLTLIILAFLSVCLISNLFIFRLVPYLELIAGIINFVLFIVVLVMFWIMSPRNNLDIFLVKSAASGWDNYFVSFNLGTLSNLFLFLGFESLIHMGEETRNPRKTVPQALFWGISTNMALGVIMIMTFGVCLPPVDDLLNSVSPLVTMFLYATGSQAATTGIISCLVMLGLCGNIGVVASVSRLTWAWARDGGLPVYFGFVDDKTRIPKRAVLGTATLGGLLLLLNLSSESYVAFAAITSLASLALYMSYAIVLACVIYARTTTPGGMVLGEWNWGRAGMGLNVFALVYTVYQMIWLPFPNVLPVTAKNMNYAGPIYLLVTIGVITAWFLGARRTWQGPNLKIVEIVLRNDEASK